VKLKVKYNTEDVFVFDKERRRKKEKKISKCMYQHFELFPRTVGEQVQFEIRVRKCFDTAVRREKIRKNLKTEPFLLCILVC